ncbi:hypothetical protein ABK040_015768 [Willaertia magna]
MKKATTQRRFFSSFSDKSKHCFSKIFNKQSSLLLSSSSTNYSNNNKINHSINSSSGITNNLLKYFHFNIILLNNKENKILYLNEKDQKLYETVKKKLFKNYEIKKEDFFNLKFTFYFILFLTLINYFTIYKKSDENENLNYLLQNNLQNKFNLQKLNSLDEDDFNLILNELNLIKKLIENEDYCKVLFNENLIKNLLICTTLMNENILNLSNNILQKILLNNYPKLIKLFYEITKNEKFNLFNLYFLNKNLNLGNIENLNNLLQNKITEKNLNLQINMYQLFILFFSNKTIYNCIVKDYNENKSFNYIEFFLNNLNKNLENTNLEKNKYFKLLILICMEQLNNNNNCPKIINQTLENYKKNYLSNKEINILQIVKENKLKQENKNYLKGGSIFFTSFLALFYIYQATMRNHKSAYLKTSILLFSYLYKTNEKTIWREIINSDFIEKSDESLTMDEYLNRWKIVKFLKKTIQPTVLLMTWFNCGLVALIMSYIDTENSAINIKIEINNKEN